MEQKEPEIINIVFGSAGIYLPNSKEWIAKVRKLLDLLEEDIGEEESKEYENSCGCFVCKSKKASNLTRDESSVQSAQSIEEGRVRPQGEIGAGKDIINYTPVIADSHLKLPTDLLDMGVVISKVPQNLIIPKFAWDKTKEKSYDKLFFFEHEDGRVMLSYSSSRFFTTRAAVLQIPFPIPRGYEPLKELSTNNCVAVRMYRRYLNRRVGYPAPSEDDKALKKREEELRKKAEINKQRRESKQKQEPKEMSERTKQLRNMVANMV